MVKKLPNQKIQNLSDLKPYILIWNDAYEDAAFDGPLEEIPQADHLQQHSLVFLCKTTKTAIKCCREICYDQKTIRSVFTVPKKYVVALLPLAPESPEAAQDDPESTSDPTLGSPTTPKVGESALKLVPPKA